MIKPTVGRIVLYHQGLGDELPRAESQLLAAIITAVWSDTCVNLCIFDANGNIHPKTSVFLRQTDSAVDLPDVQYCEWMPHQMGQAAKTDALQAELDAAKGKGV